MDNLGSQDVMDTTGSHSLEQEKQTQNQEQEEREQEQEEEYDRYKNNPQLLAETSTATRLFSFDWASGFVSPFHPSSQDSLGALFAQVEFSSPGNNSILDLGCGDAKVLLQALETFPRSQLARAVGVDLDLTLLTSTHEKILQDMETTPPNHDYAVLPRLELYHGDITTMDEPLRSITDSSTADHGHNTPTVTIQTLLQECSHIFVYLLPPALTRLAPILLEAVKDKRKVVMSMRWPIPELAQYRIQSSVDDSYYIYQA
ncbi:hypothetical protein B0O80DRAFT_528972 [Mortierella sp. GBAus27b]|nr:hypothetical protein BGX31_009760 [Mortierella sp. GBA43]KAI8355010.1 hypothetical protein B0O80DRAFT_528972 [Mortierella sp. GBAus27b]